MTKNGNGDGSVYPRSELSLGNRKLEGRLQSVQRSRLLLDRVNKALTMLKTKPRNGVLMYRIIYETYPGSPDARAAALSAEHLVAALLPSSSAGHQFTFIAFVGRAGGGA